MWPWSFTSEATFTSHTLEFRLCFCLSETVTLRKTLPIRFVCRSFNGFPSLPPDVATKFKFEFPSSKSCIFWATSSAYKWRHAELKRWNHYNEWMWDEVSWCIQSNCSACKNIYDWILLFWLYISLFSPLNSVQLLARPSKVFHIAVGWWSLKNTRQVIFHLSTILPFNHHLLPFFYIHDLKNRGRLNFLCFSRRWNNFQHPSKQARQRASQTDEIVSSIHPGKTGR